MNRTADEARKRAEARFAAQQKAETAAKRARADYAAQANAVSERTARLKALRLSKEAEAQEPAAAPRKRAVRAKPVRRARSSG